MKRLLFAVLAAAACRDTPVVDRGGKDLAVPVPSSGVAADARSGSDKDIFTFPKRAKQDASVLDVKTGPYGAYVVDGNGRSLYAFSGDVKGQTGCFTSCATVWPPVLVKKLPSVKSSAIDAARLGMLTRADGSTQLTYADVPLYYAESDLKVGSSRVDLQACKLEYSIVSPK